MGAARESAASCVTSMRAREAKSHARRYAPADLDFLGNYRRASNVTVSPRVRTTLNCLPRLKMCEARLEALVAGSGAHFRWCDDARQAAPGVRETQIKRERVTLPTLPPDRALGRSSSTDFGWAARMAARRPARYKLAKRLVGRADRDPTSAVVVVGAKKDAAYVAQVLAAQGAALIALGEVGRAHGTTVAVVPSDASQETMRDLYAAAPAIRVVFVARQPSGSVDGATAAALVDLRDGDVIPKALDDLARRACRVDHLDAWSHAFSASKVLFVSAEDLAEAYGTAEVLLTEIRDFVGLGAPGASAVLDAPRAEPLSPEHRVVVDCLPALLSCEKRLEARLQGRPGSVGWCAQAIQQAAPDFDPPRLKAPQLERKKPGWFGRRR